MMTLKDLERKKDSLFKKHPELSDVCIIPLREADWSYEKLSAFIEQCFSYDYGSETHIGFSPGFLEWNMPSPSGICVTDRSNRWLGCVLGFPRAYNRDGETRKYVIETSLCTIPEMRGRGLAQLLVWSYEEQVAPDFDFNVCWVDSRSAHQGGSKLVMERLNEICAVQPCYLEGKSVDYRKARTYGGLNTLEYAAVRAAQQVFPSRHGNRFPNGFRVEPFRAESMDGYLSLIGTVDGSKRFHRFYSRENMARELDFHKNGFHALCYSLTDRGGTPWALLHGYKLFLKEDDWAFFIDGIIFHPELTRCLKRLFLSECEGTLRDEEGCIGTTLMSIAADESLWKYGYIPFGTQMLGFKANTNLNISARNMKEMRIELR